MKNTAAINSNNARSSNDQDASVCNSIASITKPAAKFLSKQERESLALERLKEKRLEEDRRLQMERDVHDRFVSGKAHVEIQEKVKLQRERDHNEKVRREREENKASHEHDNELKAIREQYFGANNDTKKRKPLKPSEKFSKLFKADWDNDEDTAKNDLNPLYSNRVKVNPLFGRGYIGGIDHREQRQGSNFLQSLTQQRNTQVAPISNEQQLKSLNYSNSLDDHVIHNAQGYRDVSGLNDNQDSLRRKGNLAVGTVDAHWSEKLLPQMTERDWRIFREDFDIRIQGGRATLPLRNWCEAGLPVAVLRSIEDQGYKNPTPIQRQAIPLGLAWRDIIGIAETGSGKTAAFVIPLLCYLLSLPQINIDRCTENGPLAVIMAPTRELAQQIDEEFHKLSKLTSFTAACIVGGQSIEDQGLKLRKGTQVVIGTPGRICDCLQSNYLVLNQCNYVVLDEADRMVDMGFEPQVVEVLDAMGGSLKSEDEAVAMLQAKNAQAGSGLCRVTTMFSATMLPEVERIAKKYLRHPAIIKIGDEDSGKNKRIEQRVQFTSDGQKKNKLVDELRCVSSCDKVIVFINEKKQCDLIGKFLEGFNYRCGILHGGRSQDQREETLELFRRGGYQILVATDVAGRGLDIPDVSYVVNFDLPGKIDNYCHRIGRTGRAGKSGIAISFLTESDTDIMYDLKNYLESTNAIIPVQLKQHPAAQVQAGSRDDRGNLRGLKRDSIKYAKK